MGEGTRSVAPAVALMVLILARDTLGAGLIAALVDVLGHEPAFPRARERPEATVERLRPHTVLLEGYHPAARSDGFFDAVERLGIEVILFARAEPWEDLVAVARRRPKVRFVYPRPGESLADLLARALRPEG